MPWMMASQCQLCLQSTLHCNDYSLHMPCFEAASAASPPLHLDLPTSTILSGRWAIRELQNTAAIISRGTHIINFGDVPGKLSSSKSQTGTPDAGRRTLPCVRASTLPVFAHHHGTNIGIFSADPGTFLLPSSAPKDVTGRARHRGKTLKTLGQSEVALPIKHTDLLYSGV